MKNKHFTFLFLLFFLSCYSSKESAISQSQSTNLLGKSIPSHPRLLFTDEEEARIKELKSVDPLLDNLIQILRVESDKLLTTDLLTPPNDLTKSREHVYQIITLSLAHRIFDEDKYARQAERILLNICSYPDWHPEHYLDVAETTTAVAIGYDWLFSVLSEESRKIIKEAIQTKALALALPVYEAKNNDDSWAKRETNWNVVCNTGMTLGAFAIAEDYPETAEQTIKYTAQFVPNCLKHYAPDGVCYEGPAYWGYTNIYLSLLLNALQTNIGDDLGISALPGVSKTASYYVKSLSPTKKVFNFANSGGIESFSSPLLFYWGRFFNQPEVISSYREKLTEIVDGKAPLPKWHFFLSVAWFEGQSSITPIEYPPLQIFKNDYNPIVVFNGNRAIPQSLYLTAKGGDPDEAHQQLDIGTFIVEAEGVRWSDDLGADNYSLSGFWDYKPGGMRWDYFRNTNLSHNTLTIDGKHQYSAGKGTLLRYETNANNPFAIFDMSTAYKDQAQRVNRGFKLLDDRVILVQDEIVPLSEKQTICWSLITKAEVNIEGNSATLSMNGKTFQIRVASPLLVKMSVEEAKTNTEKENPIVGYRMLKINVLSKDVKGVPLQILMGTNPDLMKNNSVSAQDVLSDWK